MEDLCNDNFVKQMLDYVEKEKIDTKRIIIEVLEEEF
jgi:EAL domain-containing protein (putative c-di-GMP-specific phosphodiesterase class I)